MHNKSERALSKSLEFKQNREVSWLRFNERVLDEVEDDTVPLLEKLKFVSIYATNLDEFFMIRVGSLYDKSIYTPLSIDNKSGLTPGEQLYKIYDMVGQLNTKYNNAYKNIEAELRSNEIYSLDFSELKKSEKVFVKKYFDESIYPLLSPQIVGSHHPFPHLNNKSIYVVCLLKNKRKTTFGIVPIPEAMPPLILLPGQAYRYIHTEKIILEYLNTIFDTYQIIEKTCISVTRNADINPDDDTDNEDIDFRNQMKKLLHLRKKLAVVRLETSSKLSTYFLEYLCNKFNISTSQVYVMIAPLKMNYVFGLINIVTETINKDLLYNSFTPVNPLETLDTNMIQLASKRDLILHYPYESMKPFLQLIRQAAHDPNVISIKITIYRLAMKASLVDYLSMAAENGKEVTVLIELRARFDEQNNIDWSEKLEDAGCNIIYGFEDYKVHSKICLITYNDKGKVKFITQVGTGNYNEKTAEQYTDLSFITGNEEIGLDATKYFKNMLIGNLEGDYKHLLVAPNSMKIKLLDLIDDEIQKGDKGRIIIKINSITDIDMINKLAEASNAGVKITMIVRGICCILPGIDGMTENIEIRSIVGRFLEHTRILSFGEGKDQRLYISSADLMTRNLNRRVEVACPIYDPEIKSEINKIVETLLYDNVKARILDFRGEYNKFGTSTVPINSQELFIDLASQKKYHHIYEEKSIFTKIKEYILEKIR